LAAVLVPISIHILKEEEMDTQHSHQYENVKILMDMFDAAKALAALNDVPVEGIVNKAILNHFVSEHKALLDFHHDSGCGIDATLCSNDECLIGMFNNIRKRLMPYETGIKCIVCGESINSDHSEHHTLH
jgi:hypothetical protein